MRHVRERGVEVYATVRVWSHRITPCVLVPAPIRSRQSGSRARPCRPGWWVPPASP